MALTGMGTQNLQRVLREQALAGTTDRPVELTPPVVMLRYLRTHRVCALAIACSLLVTPGTALARGGPAALGMAVLYFLAWNLALYLAVFLCWIVAAIRWRRNRVASMVLLVAGCLPLAHYAFDYARTQIEPQRRARELAAVPRQPVPARSRPSIEVFGAYPIQRELQTLVASGAVSGLFARTGDLTEAYVRHEGWDCLDDETSGGVQAEVRRVVLARQAFRACAKIVRSERPPDAPLQLLVDSSAPLQYRGPACATGLISAIELRWAPAHGGRLVAFLEPELRAGYNFPPLLLPYPPPRVWECKDDLQDPTARDEQLRRFDVFVFLADALGYRSIDDLPRLDDPGAVPQALEKLQAHLSSRYAHDAILALMGQWPATPATDALIGAGAIARESRHLILSEAARLLGDPQHRDRQRRLYPQLASHVPALLQACALHAGKWDTKEPCRILAHVRETL